MTTFDTAISTAEKTIRSWSHYADVREVTIIRDVLGKLGFAISTAALPDDTARFKLASSLSAALGVHFSGRIYWEDAQNDNLTTALLCKVKEQRHFNKKDSTCDWYHVERTIAKKAWLDDQGEAKPVWTYEEAQDGTKPKIVTFYSFKGGMGRTTALAAVALLLAQHGKHVLVIDTDIEAPGLATLFFDESRVKGGTIDFFLNSMVHGPNSDMQDYFEETDGSILEVDEPLLTDTMDAGGIYVIPAGCMDDAYVQKLGRIDFQDTIEGNMENCLSQLVNSATDYVAAEHPLDYVLLDARAGFNDMSGVVTARLPHGAVLFTKNNAQSLKGLEHVVRTLSHAQNERPELAIVGSMTDTSSNGQKSLRQNTFNVCQEYYASDDAGVPGIDAAEVAHAPIFVPYKDSLSEEVRLYSDGTPESENMVKQTMETLTSEPYSAIEKRVRGWFGDD